MIIHVFADDVPVFEVKNIFLEDTVCVGKTIEDEPELLDEGLVAGEVLYDLLMSDAFGVLCASMLAIIFAGLVFTVHCTHRCMHDLGSVSYQIRQIEDCRSNLLDFFRLLASIRSEQQHILWPHDVCKLG